MENLHARNPAGFCRTTAVAARRRALPGPRRRLLRASPLTPLAASFTLAPAASLGGDHAPSQQRRRRNRAVMSHEERNTNAGWGRREFLSVGALGALALIGADAVAPPGAA